MLAVVILCLIYRRRASGGCEDIDGLASILGKSRVGKSRGDVSL
jgi:hypothetical protein